MPWKSGLAPLLLALVFLSPAVAAQPLLVEDFDGAFPPAGWSTVDDSEASLDCAWRSSEDYPLSGLEAFSPGAAADSNHCAPEGTPEGDVDTWLVSPELDLSDSTATVLSYQIAYRHFFPSSMATLDISTDAGSSWTTLVTYSSSPPVQPLRPEPALIDLSDYDGEPSVTLRWRYTAGQGWWVFVDNVILGPAGPGVLAVDPAELDFGEVATGIRTTLEAVVSNTANPGDADLELAALELAGDPEFSIAGGDCQADETVLAPGASCMVRIAFVASAVDTFIGELQVVTGDGQEVAVPLLGVGLPTAAIEVDPAALSATLEIGQSVTQTLAVANTGTDVLDWMIPLVHDLAGSSGGDLLRQGLLLVHNLGRNSIVALEPATGDLVDPDFVLTGDLGFGSKQKVLIHPDGERLLLTQQTNPSVVHSFDLEGNYLGVFAPAGGEDIGIMQNIRGMAFHPDTGNLLVASAPFTGAPHAVVEFDLDGNFLGRFIDSADSGVDSPWSMIFRDSDLLLAAGGDVHVFEHDGSYIGQFNDTPMNFVQQVIEAANGNILVTNSSDGVWEFDADGTLIGTHSQFGSVAGVHELPSGNLLIAANTGIHEIDREGNIVRDLVNGGSSMFSLVKAVDCTVPSWLDVAPLAGSIAVGGADDEVVVTFDATGLAPGVHEAVICVESNDPARPRVQVPIALTVEVPGDYAVIEGTVEGSGHCAAAVSPLEGALVQATGAGGVMVSAGTDANGFYEVFVPVDASPFDLIVSAAGHLDDSVTGIAVGADQVVTQDFVLALDAPCITVTDDSYHFEVLLGDQASAPLTIGNDDGAGSLEWTLGEGAGLAGNPDPRAHFPAQPRHVEHKDDPATSVGPDPEQAWHDPAALLATGGSGGPGLAGMGGPDGFQVPAYTTTSGASPPGYVVLDALVPGAMTVITDAQPTPFYAATFIGNDFDNHYMLASAGSGSPLNTFGSTDTATGIFTALGTVGGVPAVSGWNSMKWDHSTGTLYAVGNLDELFTIDPVSLEATTVGTIAGPGVNPNGAAVAAIAISPDGLMYALDLADDVLLAVDKTSGEATVIGPVGMDANFAQDMDFDQTTGILYWAAYNSGTSLMQILDTQTGQATPIGEVQGRAELLSFSIARPGGGCSTPQDIPWLSLSESAGTTVPHGSDQVEITVDTAGLAHGRYEAFVCVDSNDSRNARIWVPVSVDVTDADAGFLEGTITGSGHCSQDPQPLRGALVNITGAGGTIQTGTDADGFYRVAINQGDSPVDVVVSAAGHLDGEVAGIAIEAGVTRVEDIELASQMPCFTVDPGAIDAVVAPGGTTSRSLMVGNLDGHADLDWAVAMAGAAGHGTGGMAPLGDFQMSQTIADHILPEHSAGCPIGANHALRRFYFHEHPGVGNRIHSVDVALLEAAATSVLRVNLYTLPSDTPVDTIAMAALEPIGSAVKQVSAADNGTIVTVPVEATVSDIEAFDLVVEVVSSGLYYIGANDAGQSHTGFIIAPSCGFDEPTRLDQMEGFENTHIVLSVNAAAGGACAPPEDIAWLSVSPGAGTVAAGDSSDVAVDFDAAGLAPGEYEAVVCVHSNDPVTARIEVPVNLTVATGGGDLADLALGLFGVPGTVAAGEDASLAATVANFGPASAAGVRVELELPAAFAFVSGRLIQGDGHWSCAAAGSTVNCDLVSGTLPMGQFAAVLQVDVAVDPDAEVGPVLTTGVVIGDDDDPLPDNNTATVTTMIHTGVEDCVFGDGFEAGGDGGCGGDLADGGDPDIYHSPLLNRTITPTPDGISINWITGEIIEGFGADFHFSPYHDGVQLTFWWLERDDIAGVSADAGTSDFLVLESGDTIGPDSVFSTTDSPGPSAWAAGADGYLGFRFGCAELGVPPPSVCYGYVRVQSSAGDGFPAVLVDYAYNRRGAAITIP